MHLLSRMENAMEDKKTSYVREVRNTIIYFGAIILCVLFIHTFIGHQVKVEGSSMESTLHNKDHLILEKVTYHFQDPKRFDIVVFRPYNNKKDVYYIKRVIGLPNERILIENGNIYINGELLSENYGNNPMMDGGIASEEITLGGDEYFLLGDNRNNSTDSRNSKVGVIKEDSIIGKALIRIWPIQDFGILNK